MDNFKASQLHKIKRGGIKCPCCNSNARKGHDRVDKIVNRIARAKMKVETMLIVNDTMFNCS